MVADEPIQEVQLTRTLPITEGHAVSLEKEPPELIERSNDLEISLASGPLKL
jgi:hypothetical protein